jgi:hypothetical protein
MADYASESGHWYQKDGTPCYSIIGKNGKERPTTLRDARVMNLVPSVTTIIACAAKPGLINWMVDQGILAALTMPRLENEPEEIYITRIKADSKEQAKKAAERGTQIHGFVEKGFLGLEVGEGMPFYESALKTLQDACGEVEWKAEKSFATDRYGGKVDLVNDEYVIDIKTTDKDLATIRTWDEHALQLSAYDSGIKTSTFPSGRKCGILYIHTKTAESKLIWIDEKELIKGWLCFNDLLNFWSHKHGL